MHIGTIAVAMLGLALFGCSSAPEPTLADLPWFARNPVRSAPARLGVSRECGKLVGPHSIALPPNLQGPIKRNWARVRARIDKTGIPRDLVVLDGDPTVAELALKEVSQWRYTPCLIDADPAELTTEIRFSVDL